MKTNVKFNHNEIRIVGTESGVTKKPFIDTFFRKKKVTFTLMYYNILHMSSGYIYMKEKIK